MINVSGTDKGIGKENKIKIINDKHCLIEEDTEHMLHMAKKYKFRTRNRKTKYQLRIHRRPMTSTWVHRMKRGN